MRRGAQGQGARAPRRSAPSSATSASCEGDPHRARRGAQEVQPTSAHQDRRPGAATTTSIRRRGLHRRRGRDRDLVARWLLKRVREIKDISADAVARGRRRAGRRCAVDEEAIAIFSNLGSCSSRRVQRRAGVDRLGEPCRSFQLRDGERAVAALGARPERRAQERGGAADHAPGYGLRFKLDVHRELSTRAGRRFAKLCRGREIVSVASTGPTRLSAS